MLGWLLSLGALGNGALVPLIRTPPPRCPDHATKLALKDVLVKLL